MSELTDAPVRQDLEISAQGSHVWYELITPEPEGAKAFYETIVPGWTIGDRLPGEIDYRMIDRSDGGNAGGILRLNQQMIDHGARPVWLGYVAVDDFEEALARIEEKGGRILMKPDAEIPDVGWIAMVADPQGNPFYIMRPLPPAGEEDKQGDRFHPAEEQRVAWNELSTSDPVAARQFYGDLFGWTSEEFMPMGELGEYRFLAHEGMTIGAICGSVEGAPAGWRYYIRVPSISKAAEDVETNGGRIAMGPHEVPGGDRIIIGHDPQGAEFALVGKA